MKLTLIFIMMLIILPACGGGQMPSSEDAPKTVDDGSIPEPSISAEGPVVKTEYRGPDGETAFIKMGNAILSGEDLVEYKRIKDDETQAILDLTQEFPPEVHYPSAVTFAAPIGQSKLEEIAKAQGDGASIRMIRFVSTRGGGQIPYEMIGSQAMADLESRLKEVQKRDNGIEDFRLVEGISSFKGGLNRAAIETLMGDSNTFVVDIGPSEIYEKGGVQAAWDDVAREVARYGRQQ